MAESVKQVHYKTAADFKNRYKQVSGLSGGMSKLMVAEDTAYKRKVVVKFFDLDAPKKYQTTIAQELAERFALEAEISIQLNHPHTVRVYELGIVADYAPFIAMEYVDGGDLFCAAPAVKESGMFKLEEFLLMFYEICDTISIAHQKGILHRDLKPANVLLGKYGDLKVCDWGIAKIVNSKSNGEPAAKGEVSLLEVGVQINTMQGQVMGTMEYMAPEQKVGGAADERTDIYLLTGILYEAVTGRQPNPERGGVDTSRIFAPELRKIAEKGLHWKPEKRHQTAEELKADIKGLLDCLQREKYSTQGKKGMLSFLRKQKTEEEPEVLILSDIVKKWAKEAAEAKAREKEERIKTQQGRKSRHK